MKLFTLCILTVLIAGCAAVAGVTPTLQLCSDVSYIRHGSNVDISAKCQAPITGLLRGLE